MRNVRFLPAAATAAALLAAVALLCGARPGRAQTLRTAIIGVGQGVHFASGKVTTKQAEADIAFKYEAPQPGGGHVYVPTGPYAGQGRFEFRPGVRTTDFLPLLTAAKTASFKAPPDVSKITVGDVSGWTADEYRVLPGSYLLVRGATDGKHYLLHVTKFSGKANQPKTWRMTFTYKPVSLVLGAAGAAGTGLPGLRGVLTFRREWGGDNIFDLDLATGKVTLRFAGQYPAANARGEMAYVDSAERIIVVGADNKQKATLGVANGGISGPGNPALSPDGAKIAYDGAAVHLYVVSLGGALVADFDDYRNPAWTPDGRLVFVGGRSHPGLFITDAALKTVKRIAPALADPQYPAVSPDGKRVVVANNNRLWLASLDSGDDPKPLVPAAVGAQRNPGWSPDGKYIAFGYSEGYSNASLAVARVSDGKMTLVVDEQGRKYDPATRVVWR